MLIVDAVWPLVSKFAGGGLLLWLGALLVSRLKADKKRYLLTIEHIENAATQVGAIVGTPNALPQDIDRCRSTESYRRKAGELLHEAYAEKHRSIFRTRLKSIGAKWTDLEDAIQADPSSPNDIRSQAVTVVEEYQALKASVKELSNYRLSLIIFGHLPPETK